MNESQVFVADSFLGWGDGNGNAGEAFAHDLPKSIEFIVASLALELALSVFATHIVSDVATVVLGVLNRKFKLVVVAQVLVAFFVDSGVIHLFVVP